jgi:hypothetical protein
MQQLTSKQNDEIEKMRKTLEAERAARKLRERSTGIRTVSAAKQLKTESADLSIPLPEVKLPRRSLKNVTLKRGNTIENTVHTELDIDLVSLSNSSHTWNG